MHGCEGLYFTLISLVAISAREFRLGMMSPYRHIRLGWTSNAAAATLAIDKAKSEGLLDGHNITVKWRNDNCNALGGASNAVYLRQVEDIDVFIGPPCSSSTTPSGLLASYWNLPMFSQASSDPSLSDKSVYKTLVRLGPPFNRLGEALVEIFRYFNWDRVVMVSRRKTDNKKVFCDYSTRAADLTFRANNITVAEWTIVEDGISVKEIDELLRRVSQRGRIVVLCSENKNDLRTMLLRAQAAGMMDGNFVFWVPDHLPPSNVATPWVRGDGLDEDAKSAFRYVFQITVAEMAGTEVQRFRKLIPTVMAGSPWFYNSTVSKQGSEYSPFLHDVVYLYLLTLNETLSLGLDHRNGTDLFERAKTKTFRGITGNVKIDSNGDRVPDYWVWQLKPKADNFTVVMAAKMTSNESEKVKFIDEIIWSTEDGKQPPSVPKCGFTGQKCGKDSAIVETILVPSILVIVCLAVFIFGLLTYRRYKFEKDLERMKWKVSYNEIRLGKAGCIGSIGQMSLGSASTLTISRSIKSDGIGETQLFASLGSYKGKLVAVKRFPQTITKAKFTRAQQLELKWMVDLHHENVNHFVGMCVEPSFTLYLTEYCSKGSLQDIIENDDIKLDWIFKHSMMSDIVNGLNYIHHSPLKKHGNLKSSNCVVDNRWVLKLTDFGMQTLGNLKRTSVSEHQLYQGYFWTAPEILRDVASASQETDIYSLGIVMYELVLRVEPYKTTFSTPQEVVELIRQGSIPPFRPNSSAKNLTPSHGTPMQVMELIETCWSEYPDQRPVIADIKKLVNSFDNGRKANIVDNMIRLLEKYANNLEDIVEQRTGELIQERNKSDMLLYRMLPPSIAEKLKANENVVPEMFESASIYFSDIVGFTSIASVSSAMQIVQLLNDMYTLFDNITSRYDVYKVETIGDAYMVVSGLPVRNGYKHVTEIADMSLTILEEMKNFRISHLTGEACLIRIGLHTGPCAAGVVGLTMPRYCLFGDTVNMASRMESNGQASKIHISSSTAMLLEKEGGYTICDRGEVDIKGKGKQRTFWLEEKIL